MGYVPDMDTIQATDFGNRENKRQMMNRKKINLYISLFKATQENRENSTTYNKLNYEKM